MPASWHKDLPYFADAELRCPASGILLLDRRFAAALPALRLAWGRPLHPTSVCRSPSHNIAVQGHPRSLHLTENRAHPVSGTMAADIGWSTWSTLQRERFYRRALGLGWSCGLAPAFIHVDRRADFGLQQITFHYASWDGRFPDAA